MKYVIIPDGAGGVQTHTGKIDHLNLPDDAEIFEDQEAFETRLADFETE